MTKYPIQFTSQFKSGREIEYEMLAKTKSRGDKVLRCAARKPFRLLIILSRKKCQHISGKDCARSICARGTL